MKLRVTITTEWEVEDLAHYEASTIEEAARNQEKWLNEDKSELAYFVGEESKIKVEAVK